MSVDPLRAWWDALERGGYGPHGQPHDFRARCPLHEGENGNSLHVFTGADGRAVPHCFRCQGHPKEIALAAGVDPRDSFPVGHHRARRRQLRDARRAEFAGNARMVVNVLAGLEALGGEWYIELRCDCPHCGSPAALLQASDRFVRLSCPGDETAAVDGFTACTRTQFLEALAGRLEDLNDRRKAA